MVRGPSDGVVPAGGRPVAAGDAGAADGAADGRATGAGDAGALPTGGPNGEPERPLAPEGPAGEGAGSSDAGTAAPAPGVPEGAGEPSPSVLPPSSLPVASPPSFSASSMVTAAPSGSSSWPFTMTCSPARTPDTICTSSAEVMPTTTSRRWAFLSGPTTNTPVFCSSRTTASTGTMTAPERCSASISTCTGVPTGMAPERATRTPAVPVATSAAAGAPTTLAAIEEVARAPGTLTRAAWPTVMRVASATGTAAVTWSRRGSTRRSTCSLASMMSPGLCQRCATTPSKGATAVARAASWEAAVWVCPDWRTAASPSSRSLRASSTSLREAIPFSSRIARRS